MRLTRRVAIGIAVVCGAAAAALSIVYLKRLQGEPQPAKEPQKAKVVVARVDISPHKIITPDLLDMRPMTVDKIPRFAVKDPATIQGQVSVEHIPADDPITRKQVMAPGVAFGLAGTVPHGMRAVTVPVSPVTGLAGLLQPGDHVDVLASFELNGNVYAKTILQDVQLLALGAKTSASTVRRQREAAQESARAKGGKEEQQDVQQDSEPQPADYANATLAVTLEEAQKLMIAQRRGELQLALRRVGEVGYVPVEGDDIASAVSPRLETLLAQRKKQPKAQQEEEKPRPPAPQPQQPLRAPQPYPPPTTGPAPTPAPAEPKGPAVQVIRGNEATQVVPPQ